MIEKRVQFSEEAERAVLSSALSDPERVMPTLLVGKLSEDCFFVPAHRLVWGVLCRMMNDGERIDLLTVCQKMEDLGIIEKAGGWSVMEEIAMERATPANAEYYAKIVRNKWLLRSIGMIAMEISHELNDPENTEDPSGFLAKIPQRFIGLCGEVSEEVDRGKVFDDVLSDIEFMREWQRKKARGEDPGPLPYLDSPWPWLSQIFGGGFRNYFYVFGAESSAGKTTLISQIAKDVALKGKKAVLLSMDADPWEHAGRDMSRDAGVSLAKAAGGWLSQAQLDEMKKCAEYLKRLPLVIDSEAWTLGEQLARVRMERMKGEIGCIFVDYFQLTRLGDHKVDSLENYRIAAVCKAYKQMAREIGCPVIGLSQVNRGWTHQNRFLMKQDLRGSGEIDEVAHGIVMLYKDRKVEGRDQFAESEGCIRPVWLDVVKNKTGPLGMQEFWLYANYFRFTQAESGEFDRCAQHQEVHGLSYHGVRADETQEDLERLIM